MKLVYILRHAQKDRLGNLTDEGRTNAKLLKNKLPKFKLVIASDSPRTQETAELLTGTKPQIDHRAGYFSAPKKISEEINKNALIHPLGFVGAYLENEDISEEITKKAWGLVNLVHEILERLNREENALIVSHEITIVPAGKLFIKEFNLSSFEYLSGYTIDEDGNLNLLSL